MQRSLFDSGCAAGRIVATTNPVAAEVQAQTAAHQMGHKALKDSQA